MLIGVRRWFEISLSGVCGLEWMGHLMSAFKLKATHAPVKAYYETLERFGRGKFDNEGNIRRAFEALLEKCARTYEWFLVAEYPIPRTGRNPLKVDAAVLDAFNLPRGYLD